jgi:hypothetical protein
MKRRNFIKFTSITLFFTSQQISISKVIDTNSLHILNEIYEILFPKTSNMPSAKEFKVIEYLLSNINHKSFLDYDRDLITQGTKDFIRNFPEFLQLSKIKKGELINSIVNSNDYANSWFSKLVSIAIEALFADPIYKGNPEQIGWNSINHKIGYPRPIKKYGQKI